MEIKKNHIIVESFESSPHSPALTVRHACPVASHISSSCGLMRSHSTCCECFIGLLPSSLILGAEVNSDKAKGPNRQMHPSYSTACADNKEMGPVRGVFESRFHLSKIVRVTPVTASRATPLLSSLLQGVLCFYSAELLSYTPISGSESIF